MRADLLLSQNIRSLLLKRKQDQRELAMWAGHHETWISKILNGGRGLRLKDLDKIADFFGLTVHQLFSPGISEYTERRRGERRSGRDRRGGRDRRERESVADRRPAPRRRRPED